MVFLHARANGMIAGALGIILCLILAGAARADFICPNQDLAGRALLDQSFENNIFCVYGSGLNCTYNATTGDLLTDNDGGDCPSNAIVDVGTPTGTPAPVLTAWQLMVTAILLVSFGAVALRLRAHRPDKRDR